MARSTDIQKKEDEMFAIVVLKSIDSPYAQIYECVSEGVFGEQVVASSASWGTRLVNKSDLFATREEAERAVVDRLRVGAETIQETYRTYATKFGGM